jgi:transcriptional regulator with XRE-family HTH domain
MTDPTAPAPPTPTLGQQLLQRTRAHGMTGEELGVLLGLSVAQIRVIDRPETVDHYPAMVLRKLAERLDLPWPGWLTATPAWPDPPQRDTRQDCTQVHAVLAAAFGQPLHLSEIANVLGWTTEQPQPTSSPPAPAPAAEPASWSPTTPSPSTSRRGCSTPPPGNGSPDCSTPTDSDPTRRSST